MELVAATKMRRAVKSVLDTRSYATRAWSVIRSLAVNVDRQSHPLLRVSKKDKRIALIVIASNRGLCGGHNREIVETALEFAKSKQGDEVVTDAVIMGKHARSVGAKNRVNVIAEFPKEDVAAGVQEITAVAKLLTKEFVAGTYDGVYIAYADYYSALKQEPRVRQILPIREEDAALGSVKGEKDHEAIGATEYLFEPTPNAVLEYVLYRVIEVQIYQALLESNASEHSARMIAMRNASDAASDMIDDLTLTFNQARQAAITTEIADIAGGKAALE
jgi:F-type H+-transporting ATPase subunit gamma